MIESKFKVGQVVHCYRERNGFDFIGKVLEVGQIEDGLFEYRVENAPCFYKNYPVLIWEEEIISTVENG